MNTGQVFNALLATELREEVDSIKPNFDLSWGVFGINGYEIKKLTDLSTDHLENIIVTQNHATAVHKRTILEILKTRR